METKVTAVNGHGHLTIGGLDTVALASKYGTPLYVMDEDAIRANCRALKNSMDAHYHKKGLVLYASKAFCCKRMYRILNEEGLGADVVSGGELYTALQAGFPAERIYFHGNNKTADELTAFRSIRKKPTAISSITDIRIPVLVCAVMPFFFTNESRCF